MFLAGVPLFRKYDAAGGSLFERHIEGRGARSLRAGAARRPGQRRKVDDGEIPIVLPSVHAAAADAAGNLWIATAVGVTYVYDSDGEKQRTVQFRAAGPVSPIAMSFTPTGGCWSRRAVSRSTSGRPGAAGTVKPAAVNGASPAKKRAALGRTRYSQRRP